MAERGFLLFDGPDGAIGIVCCCCCCCCCCWRWGLFFARKREILWGCFSRFLVVFLRIFGGDFAFLGVISRFGRCLRAVRPLFRAQRDFFLVFFYAGT